MTLISRALSLVALATVTLASSSLKAELSNPDLYFTGRKPFLGHRFISLDLGFSVENLKGLPTYFKRDFKSYKGSEESFDSKSQIISRVFAFSYYLGATSPDSIIGNSFQIFLTRYIESTYRLAWLWQLSIPQASSGFPLYCFVGFGAGSIFFGNVEKSIFGLADGNIGLGLRLPMGKTWKLNIKAYKHLAVNSSLRSYSYKAFHLGSVFYLD